MSWQDFQQLITEQNSDITAWAAAADANPNTPEAALQEALLRIHADQNITMLEKFTSAIIALVRNADGLLAMIAEMGAADEKDLVIVTGLDSLEEDFAPAPITPPWQTSDEGHL
jgi:hypothetical protein